VVALIFGLGSSVAALAIGIQLLTTEPCGDMSIEAQVAVPIVGGMFALVALILAFVALRASRRAGLALLGMALPAAVLFGAGFAVASSKGLISGCPS
jgi:hypothetical protein